MYKKCIFCSRAAGTYGDVGTGHQKLLEQPSSNATTFKCPWVVNMIWEMAIISGVECWNMYISDRTNIRFCWIVRPHFYCAVWPKWQYFFLQNTKLFFALHSMPMASFHIFVLLNVSHVCTRRYHWSLGEIAKRMPTEPKL